MSKKIIFLFLSLMFLVQAVCSASVPTVRDFRYSILKASADENYLHMEIKLDSVNQKYNLQVNPDNNKQLLLTIFNTRLKNDNLKQIDLDGTIAQQISFQQKGNDIQAVISLPYNAGLADYKSHLLSQERHLSGSVLTIDVKKMPNKPNNMSLSAVAGHTIVLDPGHGGSDSGAVGPDGIMEKTITLAVAQKVYNILVSNGAAVVMTRTTDKDVYAPNDSAAEELQARVNVAEFLKNTDIFISIHANSFTNPTANGTETFYYGPSYQGQQLASFVQSEMIQANGLTDRGTSEANFYVLKHTSMPSILIELAFISNYNEESLLNSDTFQTLMAQAICRGINKYFQAE